MCLHPLLIIVKINDYEADSMFSATFITGSRDLSI